jgi:hypothetical protein
MNFSKTKLRYEVRNVSMYAVNSWSIKTHTHTHTPQGSASAYHHSSVLAGLINVKIVSP